MDSSTPGGEVRRRAAAGWAAAGGLMALTLGWPLAGAVAGLTWPAVVSDAKGPAESAADRIFSAHPGWIGWALGDRPDDPPDKDGRDCLGMLRAAEIRQGVFSGVGELRSLIELQRFDNDQKSAWNIALEALIEMRSPVWGHATLGALAGCIDGSLFKAVCSRWASQRIGDALRAHRAALIASFAEHAARAQRIACRALDGVAAPHALSN